jgi:hypothetical protein
MNAELTCRVLRGTVHVPMCKSIYIYMAVHVGAVRADRAGEAVAPRLRAVFRLPCCP